MSHKWYKKQKEFLEKQDQIHNEKVVSERQKMMDKYFEYQENGKWGEIEVEYLPKICYTADSGNIGYFSKEEFLKSGGNLCLLENGEMKLISSHHKTDKSDDHEKVGTISRILSFEASRKALGLPYF